MFNKIIVLLLTVVFFIISKDVLKGQEDFFGQHLNFDNENISGKDYYKLISEFNRRNTHNLLEKRNNYTHQIDSVLGFETGLANKLVPSTKGKIIFDDENSKEILAAWLWQDSTWVQYFYNVYHYNKKGLITKSTYNLWNDLDEDWSENNAQILRFYEYDENNRLIRFYPQDQQDVILDRITNETLYHYDSLGQLTNIELYYWSEENNQIEKRREFILKYNDQNLLVEEIDWRFIDQNWVYDDSTVYNYTDLGLLEKEEIFVWSEDRGFFIITRNLYSYNQNGSIDFIKSYNLYNEEFDFWSSTEFFEYYYHDYGSLDEIITVDSIDYFPYGLVETDIIEYKHDENILNENVRFSWPKQNHYFEDHLLVEQTEYYWSDFNYEFDVKHQIKFFYSELETNTTEEDVDNSRQVVLSPNPAQDFISIDIVDLAKPFSVKIYSSNGMLVYDDEVRVKEQISVAGFDEGIYFYNVLIDGEVVSGKFVVVE